MRTSLTSGSAAPPRPAHDSPSRLTISCTPVVLQLRAAEPEAQIFLAQQDQWLALPRELWDRLYTELQLVLAHGRRLRDSTPAIRLAHHEGRRLLH